MINKSENIIIKKIDLQDVYLLQKISKETFYETFSAENTEEDMQKYLEESLSLEKLTAELSNIDSKFYFALSNKTVIGYLKLNLGDSQTELKDKKALEIERIYILREYQRQNIGHLLYQKALEIAKETKMNYIWLGVWEENLKAINFYKKKGFIEFDRHIFKLGNDEQIDIMMKLELKH